MLILLAVPYLLLGQLNVGLLAVAAERLARGGFIALSSPGPDLRPALAVLSLVGVGTVRAVLSFRHQIIADRGLQRRLCSLQALAPAALEAAAAQAGLAGRVDVIRESQPQSFTYGLKVPRVAVSQGLLAVLSPRQLDSVLEHEAYHVRSRDPLKVMLARALPAAFFYLPALRTLQRRYVLGRELSADRQAVGACGRIPLAGALYQLLPSRQWAELAPVAGIGDPDMIEARIVQLEDDREPNLPRVCRVEKAFTALALGLVLAVLAYTVTSLLGLGVGPQRPATGDPTGIAGWGLAMMLACPMLWMWGGLAVYRLLFRTVVPNLA